MTSVVELDILYVSDPRFIGGTSTAMVTEIRAGHGLGLRQGLLPVKCRLLGTSLAYHADIRDQIDRGAVRLVDREERVSARLALVHHPATFELRPDSRLEIEADRVVLVLHHPMTDGSGAAQYDLAAVVETMAAVFHRDIVVASVSPVVRASIGPALPPGAVDFSEEWSNLIALEDWPARPARPPAYPVTLGRHSRADSRKWPSRREDAFAAYPADPRIVVRILGGGPFLSAIYGDLPANWRVEPFRPGPASGFLQGLDFYVYFHSDAWLEAFGRAILEALATGLVVILPEQFRKIFGDAAVYARPQDVLGLVEAFVADPEAYRQQSRRARLAAERQSSAMFGERLARLGVTGPAAPGLPAPVPRRQRVLLMSSNGIGLGHLSRQLALADRLPGTVEPVFVTLSYAMKLVVDAGYEAHFLLGHRDLGVDNEAWNAVLAEELFDLISFVRPRALVFDGVVPYAGLMQALASFPEIVSIWLRRAMWRPSHAAALERADQFDCVIEPEDLADAFDTGPTVARRDAVLRVPPILHVDPAERLTREEARRELGLPAGSTVVAVQLGSGRNVDMSRIRGLALAALAERADVTVVEIVHPIAAPESEVTGPRHRMLRLFPAFRYSAAFDAAISAAGYNAFHEQLLGGTPTIFVPNDAGEMDDQSARARFAELSGVGLMIRREQDLFRLRDAVALLLDPAERERMRQRMARLSRPNGACEAARFVSEMCAMARADYDVRQR